MALQLDTTERQDRRVGRYLAAIALCVVVLGTVFDLRPEAWRQPYFYRGDTMFYHVIAKSVVDHGWFLDVPLLGTPEALNLRDVPTSDNNLHVLTLWLLSFGTSHYPTVLNSFFLLGFVLVFVSALGVMRHFGVGWWPSVCGSLLYAFAPFHVARGEHHLFLTAYWQVPLAVLPMLWVSRDDMWNEEPSRRRWKLAASVAICGVFSATGFYYAFFACFFLFVASIVAVARRHTLRALWPGLALIAIIIAGVSANLSPSLRHFEENGTVPAVQRVARDADFFALRLAQLLLPVRGHRLEPLEDLKSKYNRRPLINENDDASLGVVGAVGFLGLLWWFFFRKPAAAGLGEGGASGVLHHLSIFNLAGLLFGTIGGFGSLIAFFGLPQVRAYNRISVFLCFFALFAVAVWLETIARRYASTPRRRLAAGLALATLTAVALADQISPKALPDYKQIRAQFTSDASFVKAIERHVPRGAQIFQLPFMPFPESPPISRLRDYDLLRGYLHSSHLRWSYGTIKGREGNAWLRHTASKPLADLVETLAWGGFSGIYVDRNGFSDNGVRIEQELRRLLDELPVHSPDETLFFYSLVKHRARLESRTAPAEWTARREAALNPPLTVWQGGFHDQECTIEHCGRWSGSTGEIALVNRTGRAQRVRLKMRVRPNFGGRVTVRTPLLEEMRADRPIDVNRIIALPPGKHVLRFESDGPPELPPNDFRDLVFWVEGLTLTPTNQETEDRR